MCFDIEGVATVAKNKAGAAVKTDDTADGARTGFSTTLYLRRRYLISQLLKMPRKFLKTLTALFQP